MFSGFSRFTEHSTLQYPSFQYGFSTVSLSKFLPFVTQILETNLWFQLGNVSWINIVDHCCIVFSLPRYPRHILRPESSSWTHIYARPTQLWSLSTMKAFFLSLKLNSNSIDLIKSRSNFSYNLDIELHLS